MQLGERIRYRRDRLGLSQRQLARQCAVPQSAISRLESNGTARHGGTSRGHSAEGDTLYKISQGLKCLPEYLLGTRQEYMHAWARSLPADRLLGMTTPRLRLAAVLEEFQEMYGEEGSIDALAAEMHTSPDAVQSADHPDPWWEELCQVTGIPVAFFHPSPIVGGVWGDYQEAVALAAGAQMSPAVLKDLVEKWIETRE